MKESLPKMRKFCYGVGHVMNDLCAAMWFSYILLFYSKVLLFDSATAGVVMLVGQVADGLSTPVVGILADKENKIPLCGRYGRRKVWHLLGTILVAISFPFIFNACLGCESSSEGVRLAYHLAFVCVFQFGWACVQISHLALIPDLTSKKSQRTELNSIRYAFMVLANLTVFFITFIILGLDASNDDAGSGSGNETTTEASVTEMSGSYFVLRDNRAESSDGIGPSNLHNFRDISVICIGIGLITSIIFHIGTKEPAFKASPRTEVENEADYPTENEKPVHNMRKRDWFKELPFYQIGAMYTVTRLYVNLYQTYITLFVDGTLMLDSIFIALVPLCMHFSSFLGSLVMKPINTRIGRKRTFALGCCVGIAACIWIGLGKGDYFSKWGIFLVAALLGIGGSTLLITSLSITADLIGENSEGGAFVYGFMSLLDKLSNGIVIMVIQNLDPEVDGESPYYRKVLTYACGVPCILGILITLTLAKTKVGARRRGASMVEIMRNDDSSEDSDENSTAKFDEKPPLEDKPSVCQQRVEDTQVKCSLKPICNGVHNDAFVKDEESDAKEKKEGDTNSSPITDLSDVEASKPNGIIQSTSTSEDGEHTRDIESS